MTDFFPQLWKFWPWFSASTISASTGIYHQFSLAKAWHFTAFLFGHKERLDFQRVFLIIAAQNVDDLEKLSYWLNEYFKFSNIVKKRCGFPIPAMPEPWVNSLSKRFSAVTKLIA